MIKLARVKLLFIFLTVGYEGGGDEGGGGGGGGGGGEGKKELLFYKILKYLKYFENIEQNKILN